MAISRIILVTGGARSGKSALAERIAGQFAMPRIYIATAFAGDKEMSQRIARHQKMRGPDWLTVEESDDLAGALARTDGQGVRLVDCLTLWLANCRPRMTRRRGPRGYAPHWPGRKARWCWSPMSLGWASCPKMPLRDAFVMRMA